MANEVVKINGVTKNSFLDRINYDFPQAYIVADTTLTTYTIIPKQYKANPQTIAYSDITDKLGSADIEGYCDALAENEFFFDVISDEQETVNNAIANTDFNLGNINQSSNILVKYLIDIKELLKELNN